MSYYLIHLGEGSKYEEARKEGFIAIGWSHVLNLITLLDLRHADIMLNGHPQYI